MVSAQVLCHFSPRAIVAISQQFATPLRQPHFLEPTLEPHQRPHLISASLRPLTLSPSINFAGVLLSADLTASATTPTTTSSTSYFPYLSLQKSAPNTLSVALSSQPVFLQHSHTPPASSCIAVPTA